MCLDRIRFETKMRLDETNSPLVCQSLSSCGTIIEAIKLEI